MFRCMYMLIIFSTPPCNVASHVHTYICMYRQMHAIFIAFHKILLILESLLQLKKKV